MGVYLIKDGELQADAGFPLMHLTGSGLLVVHSEDDPWAIGVGGDAGAPPSWDDEAPAPAPTCEMRIAPDATSASIGLWNAAGDGIVFTYSTSIFPELMFRVWEGGTWDSGGTAQIEIALPPDFDTLSMRFENGVMRVVVDGVVLGSVDLRLYVAEDFAGDVESSIAALVPTAFGATPNDFDHTTGGESIIDVFYDGVLDDPIVTPEAFWTQRAGCVEVL